MELISKYLIRFPAIKHFILIFLLLFVVLAVNRPVITFNLMYPEQPAIYLANQSIRHLGDLINIYLHPKLLHTNIPFFRPSGHFLIYQIMTPILGWHNTKGFIIVNLFFLAMTGYFIIRLFPLLFPSFQSGGWIAFSLYLMHPALSISRLTIMHFEFAYVFFLIFSLYLFVIFCRTNTRRLQENEMTKPPDASLQRYSLFYGSLFLYAVAVTFKEPAVMLGPVLVAYFLIHFYAGQSPWRYMRMLIMNRQARNIMIMITLMSMALAIYLLESWPGLEYGVKNVNYHHTLGTINAFLKDVFGMTQDYIPSGILAFPDLAWRTIVFPPAARLMIWALSWAGLLGTLSVWFSQSENRFVYKKSLAFLYISSILFLVLPFSWAMGAPWHYSLTLICLSMIAGFSVERVIKRVVKSRLSNWLFCFFMLLLMLLIARDVNIVNIAKYSNLASGPLGLALNRNAVLNPPDIKNKLTKDSLLVVEDSRLHNDYLMGNSAYPFLLFLSNGEYERISARQKNFYLTFHHTYSGTLFRYAYLIPDLKEELFPFEIENMDDVPNEILYNWLRHYNNIFALGYDKQGVWHDKTVLFKRNILSQQSIRNMHVNNYHAYPVAAISDKSSYIRQLSVPDEQICRFSCDQDDACRGFVYQNSLVNRHMVMQCYYFESANVSGPMKCDNCTAYTKTQF